MLNVNGIDVPLLFLSSIHRVPAVIDLLKVTVITWFVPTFIALFAGLLVTIVGTTLYPVNPEVINPYLKSS